MPTKKAHSRKEKDFNPAKKQRKEEWQPEHEQLKRGKNVYAYHASRDKNTLTWAIAQKVLKGYQLELEEVALELQQEEARRASYTLDRQKKIAQTRLREEKNNQQGEVLLNYVVRGEQNKAENLLKTNRDLALCKGTVTDLSERTFKNITAFQYAVWALDWHMWRMLLKYISPEAAAMQFQELEDKGTAHGKHFSLSPLIEALNTYVKNYDVWGGGRCQAHWQRQVGGNQLLLPVSVVNEYCHLSRAFVPVPGFEEVWLRRNSETDIGPWYTSVYNGGKLGETFGYCRYNRGCDVVISLISCYKDYARGDVEALESLSRVREAQLQALRVNLFSSQCHSKSSSAHQV